MTATVNYFALIGRSFPSDTFRDLHNRSLNLRAQRRGRPDQREMRVWHVANEPIVIPARLLA